MATRVNEKTETGLLALAERCEAAAGPDKELELAIATTIGWRDILNGTGWPPDRRDRTEFVPKYTASIDAALTLVPEGWRFYVDNGTLDGGSCHACVYQPGDGWNAPLKTGGCKSAETPALAICAAALRARSTPPTELP